MTILNYGSSLSSNWVTADASNMILNGTLSTDGIDVRNALTNIQTALSQLIFRDAINKYKDKFERFNEEQTLEMMKSFAYEFWKYHPEFHTWYAMFDDTNFKCQICRSEDEAKELALEGYCDYFTFLY